jgi:hypothetical protein
MKITRRVLSSIVLSTCIAGLISAQNVSVKVSPGAQLPVMAPDDLGNVPYDIGVNVNLKGEYILPFLSFAAMLVTDY